MMTSTDTRVSIPDPLPDPLVDAIAARFRVVGEPMRIRLLDRLRHGGASVGELVDAVGASQQNISRHLNVLYAAGIVRRRKRGTSVLYSIGDQSVFALCEAACGSLYETVAGLVELLEPTIHHEGVVR
jgi:DNA-binding transcriptional ArsR family regulator